MGKLIIPIEFFDALKKCPPIYRLMWIEWLSRPDNLFHPKFSENLRYESVPQEKIKECYAIGIRFFQEGIFYEEEMVARPKKKQKPIDNPIVFEIVEYLNLKAKTNYKPNSSATANLISGRLSEGFTKEDMIKVIDKKVQEWMGSEFEQYLRPTTLFNKTKFESYLNQPISNGKRKQPTSAIEKARNSINEAKSKLFD